MYTITFNTSRLYAADGQIITADYDGAVVRFIDHSRMVEGEFEAKLADQVSIWWGNPRSFAERVMHAYDNNTRESPTHKYWIETNRDARPQRQDLVHLFRI